MVDNDNDEDDIQIDECTICGGDIIIDAFCEEEDIVYCNDCEAEYLIRSVDPVRLKLLDEHDDDAGDGEDNFDEDD